MVPGSTAANLYRTELPDSEASTVVFGTEPPTTTLQLRGRPAECPVRTAGAWIFRSICSEPVHPYPGAKLMLVASERAGHSSTACLQTPGHHCRDAPPRLARHLQPIQRVFLGCLARLGLHCRPATDQNHILSPHRTAATRPYAAPPAASAHCPPAPGPEHIPRSPPVRRPSPSQARQGSQPRRVLQPPSAAARSMQSMSSGDCGEQRAALFNSPRSMSQSVASGPPSVGRAGCPVCVHGYSTHRRRGCG